MKATPLAIPEVILVEPKGFDDERGFFQESYNRDRYREVGIALDFVQDNMSSSKKGTLRGMHMQNPHAQGKLVSVLRGEVFDVAADVRIGSPTFGKWVGEVLSEKNHRQLWVPPGFSHGFAVLSDDGAVFSYKCTDTYHPECEVGIAYNCPTLKIDWPIADPLLSEKDQKALPLLDVDESRLPVYTP